MGYPSSHGHGMSGLALGAGCGSSGYMNRHAGGSTRGGGSGGGGGGGGSPRTGPTCRRGGRLGGRSAWASGDGIDAWFARLVGARALRFFGIGADDAVVVVWEVVAGIFPVDGGRESPDVDGFSDAPRMVDGLAGEDGKVLHAKVVVVVGCMLHDG